MIAAAALSAVLVLAPAAVTPGPDGPTAAREVGPSKVKPPPIKPCYWMWFGNWRLCLPR